MTGIAKLNDASQWLTPQRMGEIASVLRQKDIDVPEELIPKSTEVKIQQLTPNIALLVAPNGQTYVADAKNENLTKDEVLNIYSIDATPIKLNTNDATSLLTNIETAYQNQPLS